MNRSFSTSRVVDVLVVGGGHAGCEAALAAARLGKDTLLVTGSIDRVAAMSCNPAIGGVGKGHLVKELDVLGGEMGRVADLTGIHFRTLNESRGPAVRATRCQSDMDAYQRTMAAVVAQTPNLRLRQDDVVGVVVDDIGGVRRVGGVVTRHGETLRARAVVLTTGTFLGGLLHRGSDRVPGGRAGEAPAAGLSVSLAAAGLTLGRLKTGTCPRLDARTIRMNALEEQKPDVPAPRFSVDSDPVPPLPQVSCRLTRTTTATHKVITDAVAAGRSPLFNGSIEGRGPRYCPSLEDKVIRFSEKDSHLIFLEPHGLNTFEVYPNGLSTSLPPDVQLDFLRTIPGLEDVEVTRWGYAVEYDFVEPTQLQFSFETKLIKGLFCAGQLNGTTGYEEAAAQGLWAGIHAARALDGKAPLSLGREQAYLGVLIDDLITKGTDEPYRMFTSRAEHRLLLREDNVGARLLALSDEVGLASAARRARLRAQEDEAAALLARLRDTKVVANDVTNARLAALGTTPLTESTTAEKLLRRPQLRLHDLAGIVGDGVDAAAFAASTAAVLRVEAELQYGNALERAQKDIARERALTDHALPDALFDSLRGRERMAGISNEVREKLLRLRPQTLAQASRIQGITPAAIGLLAVELKKLSTSTASTSSASSA
jgi:tRNA uridine 5-carboxymethylaminomethyl modification enzyme